jgi:hypothetical protein
MSTHAFCTSGFFSRYSAFFMLMLMGLGMGGLAVYLGIAQDQIAVTVGGIVVSLGSFLLLVPVFLGLTRRPRHVEVTKDGLVWSGQLGEGRCRWDEIREVFRLDRTVNQTFTEKKLVWVLANGDRVTTDQTLSDFDIMADTIQERSLPYLLDAKRAELDKGADFGSVLLKRTGVTVAGKSFNWDEIEQSTVFNGVLYFFPRSYTGNNSEDAKLSEVPNSPILLHLLEELGQAPVPVEESILYSGRK